MEVLIFFEWALIALVLLAFWLVPILRRWINRYRLGFTIQTGPDGRRRVTISLRSFLLWMVALSIAIGSAWQLWNWRGPEQEAERRIVAAGGSVYRWNDAIPYLEYEHVLVVNLSQSRAGEHEMRMLHRLAMLQEIRLGPAQAAAPNLKYLPKGCRVFIENTAVDAGTAQTLVSAQCRGLYLENCQLTEASGRLLRDAYGERLLIE